MRTIVTFVFALLAITMPASAGEISSVYTSLDLNKCELTDSRPNEGGYAAWDCKGHKGMRVSVVTSDDRYYVSYGALAEKLTAADQTLAPFNTIYSTLEWRVERKGAEWAPFATILRYAWDDSDGRRGEILVVTKLGATDACQMEYIVANGNPNANEQARQIADTRARAFICNKETQTMRFSPPGTN